MIAIRKELKFENQALVVVIEFHNGCSMVIFIFQVFNLYAKLAILLSVQQIILYNKNHGIVQKVVVLLNMILQS